MDMYKLDYELKRNGVSAEELCKHLGISKSAFYRKKRGATQFTLEEIKKICSFLKLETPMEIFFADKVS